MPGICAISTKPLRRRAFRLDNSDSKGRWFESSRAYQKPAVRQVFCCAPLASRFVPINSAEAAPPPKAEFDVCYLNRMATRLFRQDVFESFQRGGIFIFRVQAYIGISRFLRIVPSSWWLAKIEFAVQWKAFINSIRMLWLRKMKPEMRYRCRC